MICKGYVGPSCVGGCPVLNHEQDIHNCHECPYYDSCDDCYFYDTEDCIEYGK